jgi:hypothetical protein
MSPITEEALHYLAMWVSSMTLEDANYIFCGAPKPSKNIRLLFIHVGWFQANTWKFGWSRTPSIIHMYHCSTWCYL